MTHVTLAWELGGGYGHLVKLRLLAEAYLALGVRVSLLSAKPLSAARIFFGLDVEIRPAPCLPRSGERFPLSVNYAANLIRNGYANAPALAATMAEWRDCFDALGPDLVAVEHAPTALLALRDSGLPRLLIGTGYSVPPMSEPMPSLQPWLPMPVDHLVASDQAWLSAVNAALRSRSSAPLQSVHELFVGCQRWICSYPELDYYQDRGSDRWSGPLVADLFPLQTSEPLPWAEESPLFVSLERHQELAAPLLHALGQTAVPTLVYLRGAPAGDVPVEAPNLRYLSQPVDLNQVARHCRAAICPGGFGTVWSLLRNGMRLLICPAQLEQSLLGFRLQQRGLAHSLSVFTRPADVAARLTAFLTSASAPPALSACLPAWQAHQPEQAALRIAESSLSALSA